MIEKQGTLSACLRCNTFYILCFLRCHVGQLIRNSVLREIHAFSRLKVFGAGFLIQ